MTADHIVPTGIAGLDDVLLGGFQKNGFFLLQGGPGTGKTTIALQYMLGRKAAGERCLYISLTESRRDLLSTCASHGWSFADVPLCDLTRSSASLVSESETSVFHPADTELGEVTRAVTAEVERIQPQHVVFDGLSEMRLLSGDPLRYRRQLLALKEFFAEREITVLLLDDRAGQIAEIPAESLVGGNVLLESFIPLYGRARRRLLVTKYRGRSFREGFHDYEIVRGGVMVHPRLPPAVDDVKVARTPMSSGIEPLDALLGGGVSSGSTALFLGPAGVGKSTVAMQFVVGALQRGMKAAVYAFDEVQSMLVERCEKLCLNQPGKLAEYLTNGQLELHQIDPVEITPGSFAQQVRNAVDRGAKVVLIDSMNGYLNSMPEERFLATHLHELFAYLNQRGVLTLTVVAQHGMVVGAGLNSSIDVSYLADTVLLFRYFEAQGEIRRAIGAIKKRTGPHEVTLRELRLDAKGIQIGAPLKDFHGIMTGVPEYRGETAMMDKSP